MNASLSRDHRAAARACMELAVWPEADRLLWQMAKEPADLLADAGGTRADHRPKSNSFAEKGYGRWLTFLAGLNLLNGTESPADRMTRERVGEYVVHLRELGNKESTILARLEALGIVAKVLDPLRDWSHINRVAARAHARNKASPNRSRRHSVESQDLLGLGLELIQDAGRPMPPLRSSVMFRDGLMIALLALVPLRLRNLAELTLGDQVVRLGDRWSINVPSDLSKTHVPLDYSLPEMLIEPLATYLEVHRPRLAGRRGRWCNEIGDRLWVSQDGSALTSANIYWRIVKQTAKAFGQPINPHMFRSAACTTLAIHDPEHVRTAAPLLGHRSFATTERYYLKAKSLEAHREFASAIQRLRARA